MAKRRTVDLLPEIFRTDTNKKFLSATLDQLTQEPDFKRIQGFVGRRVGPGVNPADNYIVEPTPTRANYQLEPGVVLFKPDTNTAIDAITYPGMIDALDLQDANTTRQDRLWQSQYYTWDPFCDLDKLVNYSQYYWLPLGPESVDVSNAVIPLTDGWEITRISTPDLSAYQFSDVAGNNPTITLVRGGNYTFDVTQTGHKFWIQAARGIEGRMPATPNISSRDVLGVVNNGEDNGVVTFNVPLKTAQDYYYNLVDFGTVDLISDLKLTDINNVYVDQFLAKFSNGIDGITNLDGRTVVFTNRIQNTQDGGWQLTTQYDPLVRTEPNQVGAWAGWQVEDWDQTGTAWAEDYNIIVSGSPDPLDGAAGSYDSLPFDQTSDVNSLDQRYGVWRIQYIYGPDGRPYMTLTSIANIPLLNKFRILFGQRWSNTQWYKDEINKLKQVPLLTAALDTLWYQDSTDPEIFGQIRLIDQTNTTPIDINDIIGAKTYTSPNGVVFTNGLKVQFRGLVNPPQFQDLEFYVEGVGTGPGIDQRIGFIDGEAYFGPYHIYRGQKMTGWIHSTAVFQQYIYDTIEESLENFGAGGPEGAPLNERSLAEAEIGNGIRLLPVTDFITPEVYTESVTIPYDTRAYDSTNYDANLNAPYVPDYLTVNRASRDLNAWTRSNRWFHIDVINATAQYNNNTAVLDNTYRAKRPIVEFRAGLQLYDFGTQAKTPIDIIDFSATDALSNINGKEGYIVDGYPFITGSRVIFAADTDPLVRNHVYEVSFILPTPTSTRPVIDLTPVPDGQAKPNQTVLCKSGVNLQGISFWFDGVAWQSAQQKTSVNQAPLFDIRDANGVSYGDREVYTSSTFTGSRLFGYAVGGTAATDSILGFALKYLNISNVGDILFDNYFYTDKFIYVKDRVSVELNASDGYVRQYFDRTGFSSLVGWQNAADESRSRQVFRFNYDGLTPLVMDVPPANNTVFPVLQVYVEGQFYDPGSYTITSTDQSTTIIFNESPAVGSVIEAQIISDVSSKVAFYQVPSNLESNPLNENSEGFTLGTIRNHYNTIGQNLQDIQGPINGANNTRDLGNIIRYGTLIIQQSCPLTLTGVFLRRQQYELFNSLRFNGAEYEKYKSLLLDLASRGDFVNNTPTQILDSVITEISAGKGSLGPFYWSDMIPFGETYTEITYIVSLITRPVFDLGAVYDFDRSNYRGLLIYLNGSLLVKDVDYTVNVDSPTVAITTPLSVGDVINIREYATTYGSFVPNTPTKMGLYPVFQPLIFEDRTSNGSTMVIQGHDGSITRAFGDYRDDVLLEFETRIFNNLKINTPVPLSAIEVVPGQFRDTSYTLAEINNILITDFLSWVGSNKLDYTTQNYLANNPFTWNYSQSGDRLNGEPLLGAWRGIYNYFYDTLTPSITPWEMLGLSEEPDWWEDEYGVAPYTSGNMVLWGDLEAGIVRDPNGPYVRPEYARPGLSQVIPVDSEGNLLSPWDAVVGNYDATSYRRSWTFGDGGPVESAWRSSSSYPFAVMRLLALTRPAKFFSLFADRDRYVFNDGIGQYLWDGRYRLNAKELNPLYGNGVSKASYINWIIDYNRRSGTNGTTNLTELLSNTGVRLCWRMAGFSDKTYLKIYSEAGAPNSTNTSLMLPDESYQLLLYKNQPFEQISYSSVIVQKTEDGYAVLGYNAARPYFEILVSRPAGLSTNITVGSETVRVPVEYYDNVVQVPYNYIFTNETAVCDFLLSYGTLLQRQGLIFENRENGYILDWNQMCSEFLYWSQQGWSVGSMINLNPAATRISVERPQAVVDSIANPGLENLLLNQNREVLPPNTLIIDRLDNLFRLTSQTSDTINFLDIRFTAYEHIAILDNVSVFADLLYDPITGARQNRLKISGYLSGDWTGLVNAPGFVLNENNVQNWSSTVRYPKGAIVLFKDEYWSAIDIVQPSQDFDFSKWYKSDYSEIMTGLLTNAANASDQLAMSYSVNNSNLERDVNLFSYGLIGFRPRQYMQALNLDDVSQVGLYRQFLGDKGTIKSAELFSYADLGKETAQYDIYEYWGILKSQYGATANRKYFEILLDESKLKSDPSIVQVTYPEESSKADQTVLVENIWKSSYKITSPNILPTTTIPVTDVGLPTAGYVCLDDVDITMFSLDSTQELVDNLDKIGAGTTIWVAKTNLYDWNIYRSELLPGHITTISDNLNGRALVQFDSPQDLSVGDYLIIKYFSIDLNGAYRVAAIVNAFSVLIEFAFTIGAVVAGHGLGYTLRSARIKEPCDIIKLPYANSLRPGARAWIDNAGVDPNPSPGLPRIHGDVRWEVLQKVNPFTEIVSIEPRTITNPPDQRFGTSIAQGFETTNAFVGAPGFDNGAGCVYTFVKKTTGRYEQDLEVQKLNVQETVGFGSSVDIGAHYWAVVGAPDSSNKLGYALTVYRSPLSDAIEQRQILIIPDANRYIDTSLTSFTLGDDGSQQTILLEYPSLEDYLPDQPLSVAHSDKTVQYGTVISYDNNTGVLVFTKDSFIVDPEETTKTFDTWRINLSIEFGHSVAISPDELWMYVGAPGVNKVFVFARINPDIEQSVEYITISTIYEYSFDGKFTINFKTQITVILNNIILTENIDYTVSLVTNSITLTSAPRDNDSLRIIRNTFYQLFVNNYRGVSGTTTGGGVDATFDVNEVHGQYSALIGDPGTGYDVGDQITIPKTSLDNSSVICTDLVLEVTQTGPIYTVSVNTTFPDPGMAPTESIISVPNVEGLSVGQTLHYVSGSGSTLPGATITAINGNEITVDSPIAKIDIAYDAPNPPIVTYSYPDPPKTLAFSFFVSPNYISQIGIVSGEGNYDAATVNLTEYLYTINDDIFSFTVTVDGKLYRPYLDYDFFNGTISFNNPNNRPIFGSSVFVNLRDYWTPIDLLIDDSLNLDAQFGHSISTSTDGQQVIIGAPGAQVDVDGDSTLEKSVGLTYVYDRSVERFQIIDPTVTTYTTTLPLLGPTRVTVNGLALKNPIEYPSTAQFEITGSNSITLIDIPLRVGDTLIIETNQFNLLQILSSTDAQEGALAGWAIDQCPNNCSLYIGSPYHTQSHPYSGLVEFYINQTRAYGSVISEFYNPVLTIGDSIRINDVFITATGTTVVPLPDPFSPTTGYVAPNLLDDIISMIKSGLLPNVVVESVPDLKLIGDGSTKTFDVGAIYPEYDPAIDNVVVYFGILGTPTASIVDQANYSYDDATKQITFVTAPEEDAIITVVSGRVIFSVLNPLATLPLDKLEILPGASLDLNPTNSTRLFDILGIATFVHQQNITSPIQQDNSNFGKSLFVSDDSAFLVIGAPNATTIAANTFDDNTTTFDRSSTLFSNPLPFSGAVYVYDFLPAAHPNVDNPGQWVFGQQIYDQAMLKTDSNGQFDCTYDLFGTALNFTSGSLLIGSPNYDLLDPAITNYGRISQFDNTNFLSAWNVTRSQKPAVDVGLMNTIFMYDRVTGTDKLYFDYFDPLQGRLLGAIRQNLDYIGAVDPAAYNVGDFNNYGMHWARGQVGKIWWDTTEVRFIDPNQDDIVYAARRWGQIFPGSSVDVYQWIESTVPPIEYSGPGIAHTTTSYTTTVSVNEQGLLVTSYYFWVRDITIVDKVAKKTLSISSITRYIESPRSSGISYIAPINASTVAIYNGMEYISALDTILHIEFDQTPNEDAVHVEYQLVPQDREDGVLTGSLYRKLIDSFSGVDSVGHPVPDPFLSPSEQYGVQFRPRQSFFRNRFAALENYLIRANEIISQYPLAESRIFGLLNSSEPEPPPSVNIDDEIVTIWNKRLASYEELTYQNLINVPLGYRYLVTSDANNNGLWSIYETVEGPGQTRTTSLVRVQNYDTRRYWTYIDWYLPGYNPTVKPIAEVPNYSALDSITVPNGSTVKVIANARGKFEIYQLVDGNWIRVALEDGTIEFSSRLWDYQIGRYGFDIEVFDAQYYDKEPSIETRKIIEAVNEELFIGDLALARNEILVLMFNYILQEQQAPTWLTKTSLINVNHTIRELAPFQIYQKDNQDFVLNYIQEVKPYHVQIREFNLKYLGSDVYQGAMSDFDLPAFWNAGKNMFISPVLDDSGKLSATSSYPSNAEIWQTFPWQEWYQNYQLGIMSVEIIDGGQGYVVPPVVIVTGDCTIPAEMVSRVNSLGQVAGIDIINPGQGYTTTATITLESGVGSGAMVVAIMGNDLVRSVKTVIKYDRYQYQSDVTIWEANVIYNEGSLVRYADRAWVAMSTVVSDEFNPDDWYKVPAEYLSGVDRTYGFYAPGPNEPGLDLSLLISGLDYPGVQVYGLNFDENTGFDYGSRLKIDWDVSQSQDPLYLEGYRDVSYAPHYSYDKVNNVVIVTTYPGMTPPQNWVGDRFTGGAGFDTVPYDNISYGPEGRPTYDTALLDAIYESNFIDPYLGVGPAAINVDGGQFVDTYSSHAPEELVPGAIFDTVDIRVITTPGSDWQYDGHGFSFNNITYEVDPEFGNVYSFAGVVKFPVSARVLNQTTGTELLIGEFYIDWPNQSVIVDYGVSNGDIISISVFEVGGGNQMYRNIYNGADVNDGIIIPVPYNLLSIVTLFVNGDIYVYADYSVEPLDPENLSSHAILKFVYEKTSEDYIALVAYGSPMLEPEDYLWSWQYYQFWSTLIREEFEQIGPVEDRTLISRLTGTNPANMIVELNGLRARPPEGAGYHGDGVTVDFALPTRGGYSQALVSISDVQVYVNNVQLVLIDGTYTLSPWEGTEDRYVTLTVAPEIGANILVTVSLMADYSVQGFNLPPSPYEPYWTLTLNAPLDESTTITIFSWNDTSQQDLLTQVFVGPTYNPLPKNEFAITRLITDKDRVMLTVNGRWIQEADFTLTLDYIGFSTTLTISGPIIADTDVVVITTMTSSVVVGSIEFGIFQDMRGTQTTYREISSTITELTSDLLETDDIIYVKDAGKLNQPNLPNGVFGQIMIGGEFITYRYRDANNNTLSGLRRGVAGTGVARHLAKTFVYDMSRENRLPAEYQDKILVQNFLGNGNDTIFVADELPVIDESMTAAIQVYIGGILQTEGYTISSVSPITVEFDVAPTSGYQISVQIRQGLSWYQPGIDTASDGVSLQETNTLAARFIKGQQIR